MAGISFGGIVSGLDTGSIVSQLVALRRQPIQRLETKKTNLNRSIAAMDDLKAALAKLDSAAKALDTQGEFNSKVGRSGNEDFFTASADSSTPNGVYQITVDRLAQTHREVSQSYASTTDSVGTGDFTFTLDGVVTTVSLTAGGDTLADLKSAINAADAGVNATIVNDGTGYRLLLGADESGVANRFTVDASGLTGGTALTITNSTLGDDAQITIDGSISVTSSTNTVSDALEGLKLELKAEGTTEVTVEGDSSELAKKIQAFADAYNGVVDLLDNQNKAGGALENSPLVRTIRSRLSSTMTSRVDTGGTFGVAADIGLSLDRYGKMVFDSSKLGDAIEQDYQSVLELFTREAGEGDVGIASAIKSTVDGINASSNGLLRFRKDAIDSEIKRLDSRIERDERSISIYEQTLNRKFSAMEQTISRLQSQAGFFFR